MSLIPAPVLQRLKIPAIVLAISLVLLGINVLLGLFVDDNIWYVELLITACLVVLVILFSMEIYKEPPIVRLFAALGFIWVAILFGMMMIDYATR